VPTLRSPLLNPALNAAPVARQPVPARNKEVINIATYQAELEKNDGNFHKYATNLGLHHENDDSDGEEDPAAPTNCDASQNIEDYNPTVSSFNPIKLNTYPKPEDEVGDPSFIGDAEASREALERPELYQFDPNDRTIGFVEVRHDTSSAVQEEAMKINHDISVKVFVPDFKPGQKVKRDPDGFIVENKKHIGFPKRDKQVKEDYNKLDGELQQADGVFSSTKEVLVEHQTAFKVLDKTLKPLLRKPIRNDVGMVVRADEETGSKTLTEDPSYDIYKEAFDMFAEANRKTYELAKLGDDINALLMKAEEYHAAVARVKNTDDYNGDPTYRHLPKLDVLSCRQEFSDTLECLNTLVTKSNEKKALGEEIAMKEKLRTILNYHIKTFEDYQATTNDKYLRVKPLKRKPTSSGSAFGKKARNSPR